MVLAEAEEITRYMWRTSIRIIAPRLRYCNACNKEIGIGDRIGYTINGRFIGFNCKECFDRVLEAQRMN